MSDLTREQRSHRMNIRNAYFLHPNETLQLAIDCATAKKATGWKFKVQCLEELKGENE
jgi:hypothetical protein